MIDVPESSLLLPGNLWEFIVPSYGLVHGLVAYMEYKRKYPKRKGASWETLAKRIKCYGGKKGRSAWKRYQALAKRHRQEDGRRTRQMARACGREVPLRGP